MRKKEKEEKTVARKDLVKLKKEIAEKGKEIEQLKKTIEELRTKIQGEEETTELRKIFEDASEVIDAGFTIFGTSKRAKGTGFFGLISDLAKLAERSETYQKRFDIGKRGIIDIRVSSRPIRRTYPAKPACSMSIIKQRKSSVPTLPRVPATLSPRNEGNSIVDIFEEEDWIRVVTEIRGVEEKEIRLNTDDNTLRISTEAPGKKLCKKVVLPAPVEKDSVESKYRNGVLEVRLRKAKNTARTGKEE